MPVCKKDLIRVLEGEKRVRAWHEAMRKPANNPVNKDGERVQIRARFARKGYVDNFQEEINRDQAIASGGIVAPISMRSADSKFARMSRSRLDVYQGKEQEASRIILTRYKPGQKEEEKSFAGSDGHVYGSIQKVGRSLEEIAHDEGMGPHGMLIGKGKGYAPSPVPVKRDKPSPFKRRWKESTFKVEVKK